jgi:hypothetical protein
MWRILAVLSSLAMLLLAPAASAADLVGQASIIDGDTIEIHGQRIRLFGIDAPDHDQLREAAGIVPHDVDRYPTETKSRCELRATYGWSAPDVLVRAIDCTREIGVGIVRNMKAMVPCRKWSSCASWALLCDCG